MKFIQELMNELNEIIEIEMNINILPIWKYCYKTVNDNGILRGCKIYKIYKIPLWYDLYRHSNTLQINDKCEILEKLKYSKFLSKHLTKSRYLVISVASTDANS